MWTTWWCALTCLNSRHLYSLMAPAAVSASAGALFARDVRDDQNWLPPQRTLDVLVSNQVWGRVRSPTTWVFGSASAVQCCCQFSPHQPHHGRPPRVQLEPRPCESLDITQHECSLQMVLVWEAGRQRGQANIRHCHRFLAQSTKACLKVAKEFPKTSAAEWPMRPALVQPWLPWRRGPRISEPRLLRGWKLSHLHESYWRLWTLLYDLVHLSISAHIYIYETHGLAVQVLNTLCWPCMSLSNAVSPFNFLRTNACPSTISLAPWPLIAVF